MIKYNGSTIKLVSEGNSAARALGSRAQRLYRLAPLGATLSPMNRGIADAALRRADVASLLADADIRQLAAAVAEAAAAETAPVLVADRCFACNRTLGRREDKARGALVLSTEGFRQARHVPGRCRAQDCPYRDKHTWATFVVCGRGKYVWPSGARILPDCIMLLPSFGVTLTWYRQFSWRLATQHVSFESEASVHTLPAGWGSVHRVSKKLRDAWFRLRLLERRWECGVFGDVSLSDRLEGVLSRFLEDHTKRMRQRRRQHWEARGVRSAVVVVDGNQKLTRPVCAELFHTRISGASRLGLLACTRCTSKPRQGSLFCSGHAAVPDCTARDTATAGGAEVRRVRLRQPCASTWPAFVGVMVARPDRKRLCAVEWASLPYDALRRFTHRASRLRAEPSAPETASVAPADAIDDDSTLAELAACACRTHKMGAQKKRPRDVVEHGDGRVAKARRVRTGGVLLAASPDGMVMDVDEFMDAESLVQRYFFMSRVVDDFPEITVCVHDDACHLRRFADRRKNGTALAQRLAWPSMRYFVDRFHSKGHVDPWCAENCSPDTQEAREVLAGVDTSRCEQLFRKLNGFKKSFRSMGRATAMFYLSEMVDAMNEHALRKAGRLHQNSGVNTGALDLGPVHAHSPSTTSTSSSSSDESSSSSSGSS